MEEIVPHSPTDSAPSQDVSAASTTFTSYAAPTAAEASALVGDLLLHSQADSQASCSVNPPSHGAPQDVAAAGPAFAGHSPPTITGASAQGTHIFSAQPNPPALSESPVDRDHPMEEPSPCFPVQDYLPRLLAPQLSIPPASLSPPHPA